MTKLLTIFLLAIMLISCESKQWNLNKAIGWKSINPDDYAILYLKWNSLDSDSIKLNLKTKLDSQILKELRLKNLGDQVEKDDSTETDLHFIVCKDYKKALKTIVSITKSNNISETIIVYQRQYTKLAKWNDKAIYTLEQQHN